LRIVADEAIGWLEAAFGDLGRPEALPAHRIDRAAVRNADVLLTRTVTRVDAALLEGSRIGFVGSCTAGTDHVDLDWLHSRGIAFAHAPGCNARAVTEWVITALHTVWSGTPAGTPLGPIAVVGFGQIGRRVTHLLRALGHAVRVCDPPLEARRACAPPDTFDATVRDEELLTLDEALRGARAVTLHVPLQTTGSHPSVHLLDADRLALLDPQGIVVNTSRGSVVDDAALESWARRTGGQAIVDTWEGEPRLRWSLLDGAPAPVRLASPHVAGYTCEGKVGATAMVHEALAAWLGRAASFETAEILGEAGAETIMPCPIDALPPPAGPPDGRTALARCLLAIHPLHRDDASVRALLELPPSKRARAFEMLRRQYPLRREAAHFRLAAAALAHLPSEGLPRPLHQSLSTIGLRVTTR
jgi:erythronate-4-phosphate dehydrogenase